MFDIVLFNDLLNFPIPAKTAGAYRIASHLRHNGYSVKVIDHFNYFLNNNTKEFFKIIEKYISKRTFLIGISTSWLNLNTNQEYLSFEVFLKYLKNTFTNAKIVLGGNTFNSQNIFDHYGQLIDHWVTGLGETAMLKLSNSIKNGISFNSKKITIDPLASEFDFHNSPPMYHIDDDILDNETLPLELSRGCRFRCKFCAYPLLGRNPKEHKYIRSDYSISKELEHNFIHFKTQNYFMVCDTFNETTDKLLTIKKCADDVGVRLNFSAYIRLDLLNAHPEQIDILKELGICSAFFGIESLHDPSAKAIGKGMGRDKVIECLNTVRQQWGDDVVLHGNFIFGLPYENKETINDWIDLLINKKLPLDSFRIDPLHILMDRLTHSSEFEMNASAYGYTMKSGNEWQNEYWSKSEVTKLANDYMSIADKNNIRGVNSWTAMALRNFNWSPSKIKSLRHSDLNNNQELANAKKDYLTRYLQKIQ